MKKQGVTWVDETGVLELKVARVEKIVKVSATDFLPKFGSLSSDF